MNYKRLEGEVIGSVAARLTGRGSGLDRADIEEAYNLAWSRVYQMIARGGTVKSLTGLLIDITHKRALDMVRQRHEALHVDADLATQVVDLDLAGRIDDRQKIQGLVARLKVRLSENERRAVALCLMHGYKRREAARMLGVREPAFQKIMNRATKKIAEIVAGMRWR